MARLKEFYVETVVKELTDQFQVQIHYGSAQD